MGQTVPMATSTRGMSYRPAAAGSVLLWVAMAALVVPTVGCDSGLVLSGYGSRLAGTETLGDEPRFRHGPHPAVDFRADVGDPVLASAAGYVMRVARDRDAGGWVVLHHGTFSRYTTYLHLADIHVDRGAIVQRGDVIGTVGMFRYSGKFPHVHLELCVSRCSRAHADGDLDGTEDPMKYASGCFERGKKYPTDRLVLTFPIRC